MERTLKAILRSTRIIEVFLYISAGAVALYALILLIELARIGLGVEGTIEKSQLALHFADAIFTAVLITAVSYCNKKIKHIPFWGRINKGDNISFIQEGNREKGSHLGVRYKGRNKYVLELDAEDILIGENKSNYVVKEKSLIKSGTYEKQEYLITDKKVRKSLGDRLYLYKVYV